MNITKRGKSWWIREMRNRKLISITIDHKPTRKEALELLDIKENTLCDDKKTLYNAIECYINSKDNELSPSTIHGYRENLRRLNERYKEYMELDIHLLTKIKLQNLVNELAKSLSPKTVRNYYVMIKTSLDDYDIHFNITLPMKVKKIPYIPDDNDIKKLLELTKGSIYEIPIELALNGLRRSEIGALTIDDIGDGEIKVDKAKVISDNGFVIKSTKTTESTRIVKVSKRLTDKIKKQGYIYQGHINNISKFLLMLHQSYGLPHYSLHKLRHYYVSMMMTLGVPAPYIMEQGGWATDRVMKSVYTHTFRNTDFADKGIAHIESITPL